MKDDTYVVYSSSAVSARGGISLYHSVATAKPDGTSTIDKSKEQFQSHPRGLELLTWEATTYPFIWQNMPDSLLRTIGFEFGARYNPRYKGVGFDYSARGIVLPYWFLTLLFVSMPIGWGYRVFRRRRRDSVRICVKCGYDLRASHDRCPECGTPFAHQPAAT